MFWEFSVDILSLVAVLITYLFKVLKPLSAECHVVMDQSSEIVLDTPKVFEKVCKFLFLKSSLLLVENHYSLFFKIFFFFTASDWGVTAGVISSIYPDPGKYQTKKIWGVAICKM